METKRVMSYEIKPSLLDLVNASERKDKTATDMVAVYFYYKNEYS
jgi:hypothetical protein